MEETNCVFLYANLVRCKFFLVGKKKKKLRGELKAKRNRWKYDKNGEIKMYRQEH